MRRYSEEEYLEGAGQDNETHYEFVEGRYYAMATPTDTHSFISSAIFVALYGHLRGKPCKAFKGDMKLRINFLERKVHYIPDVMVACDEEPRDRRFREEPVLLVEVLSESTRGVDEREKLFAYSVIGSLQHYLLVEQDTMQVTHFRRLESGWTEETFIKPEQVIEVPELDFKMSLAAMYA